MYPLRESTWRALAALLMLLGLDSLVGYRCCCVTDILTLYIYVGCVCDGQDLVVPNLDHPVLRGLMAGTFYSVCIVDSYGLIMFLDVVILLQRHHA